jgi:hypothetical protein
VLAAGALASGAWAGCRITPDEIQRIETENELLRQQIQVIRKNCDYYQQQELKLQIEQPTPAPKGDDEPAP